MNHIQLLNVLDESSDDLSDSSDDGGEEDSSSDFLTDDGHDDDSGEESEHEYVDRKLPYRFRLFHIQEEGPFPGSAPRARSGHRIVFHQGSIYSFGGYNPDLSHHDSDEFDNSSPLFRELWKLNLSTSKWSKIKMQGDVPEQLASHTAVLHPAFRGVMIVYGGTGVPFGLTSSNQAVTCILETGRFSKLESTSSEMHHQPPPLYGQAVTVDEKGMFYTVGGTGGIDYYMDVHRLDLTENPPVWEALNNQATSSIEPQPRYRHEICVQDNKLYVFGGGTSNLVYSLEDIPTFCLKSRRWISTKTKPDVNASIDRNDGNGFPEARRYHGVVHLSNKVYVVGGTDGDDIFGDIWRLDLANLQWRKLPRELPVPVYFHANAISEDGKLTIFGGVDNIVNNSRTSRVYTTWLEVPPLRAIAMEAVQHYIPHIDKENPKSLLEMGIPRDCIQIIDPKPASCG